MLPADLLVARRQKAERLRTGAAPRVLEICSGCGGLALGLAYAGFALSAHVEIDPDAAASYALNFSGERSADHKWALARDMEHCPIDDLTTELGLLEPAASAFDVLAAGLPCQAFARIGRSKLRAVLGKDDAFRTDPRAALYLRFLEFVRDTQPLAIIIENVPDILNFGGHNVPEEICVTLEEAGYRPAYTILNSAFFGVPQVRERLFIVAITKTLDSVPTFPDPTHFLELPLGYQASRHVALKHVDADSKFFRDIHDPANTLPLAVTVREALDDLPLITEHRTDPHSMRRRKIDQMLPYSRSAPNLSGYARAMREWPGFETGAASDILSESRHATSRYSSASPTEPTIPRPGSWPSACSWRPRAPAALTRTTGTRTNGTCSAVPSYRPMIRASFRTNGGSSIRSSPPGR